MPVLAMVFNKHLYYNYLTSCSECECGTDAKTAPCRCSRNHSVSRRLDSNDFGWGGQAVEVKDKRKEQRILMRSIFGVRWLDTAFNLLKNVLKVTLFRARRTNL